jgi:hypothetical protein
MSLSTRTTLDDREHDDKPWYRYGWPWFLISFPVVSMVLGAMMFYLGSSTNNSLVVDDYYREGKSINQRIERDRAAALIGLNATLWQSSEGVLIEVSRITPVLPSSLLKDAQTARAGYHIPEALQISWVHVTQAERDGKALLQSIGRERYLAPGISLPGSGKFRVHLQPLDDASWRLVSPLTEFDVAAALNMPAPLAEAVFNKSAIK